VIDALKVPGADAPLSLSVGVEYREEFGGTTPDECLKLFPTSCLGGNGGNTLPIFGGFSSYEYFTEAILPVLSNLDLEVGYRYADYDPSGGVDSYKYGVSYQPLDSLRIRAMQQRAVRAPNVEEIASPRTTGLDNARGDPCSIGNVANIDATLRARCVATGMSNAQVGTVEDIAAGQVNVFTGTNLSFQLEPEVADTTTFGIVWQPPVDFVKDPQLTIDYYKIKIEDYINSAPAQGVLDGCYLQNIAIQCAKIHRLGGTLTVDGSGVDTLFENLGYLQAEGIEIGASFGVELPLGELDVSFNGNHYLSNEFQSYANLPVTECVGFFSASCGNNFGTPLPEDRWIQRTTWNVPLVGRDFQFSYLWRHTGEVKSDLDPTPGPTQTIDPRFYKIEAFDYLDLTASVRVTDGVKLTFGVTNVFDEDPPAVGNEAADTSSNSLNTFPSTYDPLGQVYSISLNARF
jgi:outer membrane receptor protein involved in Fe transport